MALTRRRLLAALGLGGAGAATAAVLRPRGGRPGPGPDVAAGPTRTIDAHGEWWVPSGPVGRLPTVVLVHGGYWRAGYDRHLEDAVAADLAKRGFLVWNIDYRPSSAPWPATLSDAAAAYDAIGTGRHADRVARDRVAIVGHSAGGHLALWLASRDRLPDPSPGAAGNGWLPPRLAIGQAPVAALVRAARQGLGGGAAAALCGGSPTEVPGRYRVADPVALVPASAPAVLVHGTGDDVVPIDQSETYVAAAHGAGGDARLQRVPGGHFEHLDPGSAACAAMRSALDSLRD